MKHGIKKAALEQNAGLPEEEIEDIRQQLARFKSFINFTQSSQLMIANLVEKRRGFEYNSYNFRLRRSVLEADDGPCEEEYYEVLSLIASSKGWMNRWTETLTCFLNNLYILTSFFLTLTAYSYLTHIDHQICQKNIHFSFFCT